MKLYVITHKEFTVPPVPPIYVPLQVGTSLNNPIINTLHDNEGMEISMRNKSYNELTGLYWIWKNIDEDIVGLCHYRRYFVTPLGKLKNLLNLSSNNFLDYNHIKSYLKKNDMIVHNRTFFRKGCGNQFKNTQQYPDDLTIVRDVILTRCPDYIYAFDQMSQKKTCHLLNVLISKKATVDSYCEWLFDILFATEKQLLVNGEEEFERRLGMIGERLLDVWIIHNKIKTKECFMINTERNDWKFW